MMRRFFKPKPETKPTPWVDPRTLPWNKEYLELVTPAVSKLLWETIDEAKSAGWEVYASGKLLHEGAKDLGRAMLNQNLSPDEAKMIARQIVRPYARSGVLRGWW